MANKYSYGKDDFYNNSSLPEFNQMGLYLTRVDSRQNERDIALNTGDLITFYRCTLSLLMNCIPKFTETGIEFTEVKTAILKIGGKLKSSNILSKETAGKNNLVFEEELWEQNILLNELMFKAGMVYPLKSKKEHNEVVIQFIDKFIDEKVMRKQLQGVENAD